MQGEEIYWGHKARELSRNQLENIQSAATKWAGTTTALLGVFGTVTVVSGVDKIENLESGVATTLKLSTTGAVVLALTAIVTGAFAAQGVFKKLDVVTGKKLKELHDKRAGRARTQLFWSRVTAVLAAIVVVGGATVALWVSSPRSEGPDLARVLTSDGAAHCGELHQGDAALELRTSNATVPLSGGTASVTAVDSCPD